MRERTALEELRHERGWPTPNHMRTAADALDVLTPARYGDVLRWFADKCDEEPAARAALADNEQAAGAPIPQGATGPDATGEGIGQGASPASAAAVLANENVSAREPVAGWTEAGSVEDASGSPPLDGSPTYLLDLRSDAAVEALAAAFAILGDQILLAEGQKVTVDDAVLAGLVRDALLAQREGQK